MENYWLDFRDYFDNNRGFDKDAVLPDITLDFNDNNMTPVDMYYHFSENLLSLPTYSTKKFGVLNTKGEIVIPFEYEFISPFHQGYAYFFENDKVGFFNQAGEIVIPPVYDSTMGSGENCFSVSLDNRWICINDKNECIFEFEPWVKNPKYFVGDYATVINENLDRRLVINKNHETVIDPNEYGVWTVECEGWYDYFEVNNKQGLLGFMDKDLNFVIPCQYKRSYFDPIKKLLLVSKEDVDDKMFYINHQGEIIGEFLIYR